MITQVKKRYISIITGFIAVSSIFVGVYFYSKPSIEIKNFDKIRDIEFVKNAFNNDYYWLVENPEFSLDHLITTMSPNKDPEYLGKLNFKILFENDKPAGFTTYYKRKFYQGKIQFVYVDPKFRNKGHAKKLTKYASNDLFKMGVAVVDLSTRISNTPAIKAYKSLGFNEVYRDDAFVDFEVTKDKLK